MREEVEIIRAYASRCPVNVEALIRELGIELDEKADLEDHISGQIQKLDDSAYKIAVNKNDKYYRRRFTMAHELGHLLYHQGLIGAGITDDKLYRSTSDCIKQHHELEASKFAAALLMPKPLVQADYERYQDINHVALRWHVTPKALRVRLGV